MDLSGMADAISRMLVPIHRDGHKFLGISLAVTILAFLVWSTLGWILLAVTGVIAVFFRDPARVTPVRAGLVLAPADGEILAIETVAPPPELTLDGGERVRISTYLSPLDVHINRTPMAGRVTKSVYVPGAFLHATLDKASDENERRGLVITSVAGAEVVVTQIAGFISRRIVTFVVEGDTLAAGQRIGLIRFGSRVDVYLPPGKAAHVAVGQRAVAGETVLADITSDEPEREARRS